MKSIDRQFRSELIKQRRSGALKGSRQAFKARTGKHASYTKISSDSSYKKHLSRANQFAKWCKTHKIKKMKNISHETAIHYLKEQIQAGKSASLVGADALAINHLMIGAGFWKIKDRVKKSQIPDAPKRSYKLVYQRNQPLTASEWQQANPELYQQNKQAIDTIRAFGLRRTELIGVAKYHHCDGLGTQSLYINDSGRLYALVWSGKGGKTRLAPCLKEKQDEMLKYYGKYVQSVHRLPKDTNSFKAKMFGNKPFMPSLNSRVPSHINRALYAQKRLSELNTLDFRNTAVSVTKRSRIVKGIYRTKTGARRAIYARSKTGAIQWKATKLRVNGNRKLQIGAYNAQIGAFKQLSKDLGHNRLDVLRNYLR